MRFIVYFTHCVTPTVVLTIVGLRVGP